MPLYTYRCRRCGHTFKVRQMANRPPLKTCPVEGCTGKLTRTEAGWIAADGKAAEQGGTGVTEPRSASAATPEASGAGEGETVDL